MIRNLLAALIICFIVVVALVWILRGGFSRALSGASFIGNPVAIIWEGAASSTFKLPWQPDPSSYVVPLEGVPTEEGGAGVPTPNTTRPLMVRFTRDSQGPSTDNPLYEYISIQTDYDNPRTMDITGYSIYSLLSHNRLTIPPTTLAPGDIFEMITGGSAAQNYYDGLTLHAHFGLTRQLWYDDHDALEILDTRGRPVDTFTY